MRWWFDSGSFALDFAYTGGMPGGPAERLTSPETLDAWLAERVPMPLAPSRPRERLDAISLRDAIGRLALAASRHEPGAIADIDLVNLFAATPDLAPGLAGGSRQAGASVHPVARALSTIARDAVGLLAPDGLERIRVCGAEDCGIVYLDTSRAGTRRWCSMQRCGNRAKVRAHRERAKRTAEEQAGSTPLPVFEEPEPKPPRTSERADALRAAIRGAIETSTPPSRAMAGALADADPHDASAPDAEGSKPAA
ncbi:CGNR zinc finger domain-containing protein [Agromyces archimandritae]|uniref:CGNR zinc finger domain-containing protein n=2 Tax=Agromyces archimandritae TaxID=2781962 RepID=A0A975FQJ9_9MICO|nr:CGNR zinc finger domain-containing protein [Agromyces archimandritae]